MATIALAATLVLAPVLPAQEAAAAPGDLTRVPQFGHVWGAVSVDFSPDGRYLASLTPHAAILWDLQRRAEVWRHPGASAARATISVVQRMPVSRMICRLLTPWRSTRLRISSHHRMSSYTHLPR